MRDSIAFATREELESARKEIAERRSVYMSDAGRRTLAELIRSSGVLDRIDPGDVAMASNRNFVISILESMDMINDAGMDDLVAYLLSRPILSDCKVEGIDG